MTFRTRFAPSPTGPLHLGHAFSALTAWRLAQENDGAFLLRIEDIDRSRARVHWETQIFDDLRWLGLDWPEPVMRQSDRQAAYDNALDILWDLGLLYSCTCTRRDIENAMSAPQEGVPVHGPDGLIYPGTCRDLPRTVDRPKDTTLRLNMDRAITLAAIHRSLSFDETGAGMNGETGRIFVDVKDLTTRVGDIVVARRDMGTSYHLSVVLDDAALGISHVVRGADLFEATQIHILLQHLLELPTPCYHHHRLIRDENGKRLAKRDDARAIDLYRKEGKTVTDIITKLGT